MTSFQGDLARDVAVEVNPEASNYDPGQGDISGANYHGMPMITHAEQHPNEVPETFEDAHPELSYTNAPPRPIAVPTTELGAPIGRTRSFMLSAVGDPTLILQANPKRRKALISTIATTVAISDDPAALQGMSAGNPGLGFGVPAVPIYWESTAALYGMLTSGASLAVSVIEYIDN